MAEVLHVHNACFAIARLGQLDSIMTIGFLSAEFLVKFLCDCKYLTLKLDLISERLLHLASERKS